MAGLAGVTWLAFGLWMLAGLICYFLYGYRHSRLNAEVPSMKFDNVLTGFVPMPQGRDGLALAVLLARQAGARLTVANVQPPAWAAPGPGQGRRERVGRLPAGAGRRRRSRRRGELAGEDADYVAHTHKGSGRGLVELARKRGADAVVIGSAPRRRAAAASPSAAPPTSSCTPRPVPVVLAPRGYADDPPAALDRLTVAYRRGPCADAAVRRAADARRPHGRAAAAGHAGGERRAAAPVEMDMLARLRDQARPTSTPRRAGTGGARRRGGGPGGQGRRRGAHWTTAWLAGRCSSAPPATRGRCGGCSSATPASRS